MNRIYEGMEDNMTLTEDEARKMMEEGLPTSDEIPDEAFEDYNEEDEEEAEIFEDEDEED